MPPVTGGGEKAMNKPNLKVERLAGLFLLGSILFNYPILALFNRFQLVAGIPLLYLYAYAAWALVIVLLVLAIEKR